MPGFDTDTVGGGGVLYATNVDFTGSSLTSGTRQVTTDGQLLIGSTSIPNIGVGKITSPLGTLNIGYSSPNITLDLAGGGKSVEKITGNDAIIVTPSVSGNINFLTSHSTVKFAGTTNTETLDFAVSNMILGSSATAITSAAENTGIGNTALNALTSGQNNTACGWTSLAQLTTSSNNVAVGNGSLNAVATGNGANTAIGFSTMNSLSTGDNNIAVGNNAGSNYTGAETSNIAIGSVGTTSESNVIRIGTTGSSAGQQNKAFIAGITGVTVAASAPVGVASTGQQSSLGFGTSGQIFTSTGAGSSPTWQANAATFSPNAVLNVFDDFVTYFSTGALGLGSIFWDNINSGIWATDTADLTNGHPGVISSPVLLSSDVGICWSNSVEAGVSKSVIVGGGSISFSWIINLVALSTGTNRYTLRLGMGDTVNADEVNGIYFEYSDNINSGNWNIKTASASTRTTTSTSTAASLGWHNLTVTVNAAGTSCSFFDNGVSLGTIATNIPATGIGAFLDLIRSAGTIAVGSIAIDLFSFSQTLTTPR